MLRTLGKFQVKKTLLATWHIAFGLTLIKNHIKQCAETSQDKAFQFLSTSCEGQKKKKNPNFQIEWKFFTDPMKIKRREVIIANTLYYVFSVIFYYNFTLQAWLSYHWEKRVALQNIWEGFRSLKEVLSQIAVSRSRFWWKSCREILYSTVHIINTTVLCISTWLRW